MYICSMWRFPNENFCGQIYCMYLHIYNVHMYTHTHVYIYPSVYLSIYQCVCVCVCVCLCMPLCRNIVTVTHAHGETATAIDQERDNVDKSS